MCSTSAAAAIANAGSIWSARLDRCFFAAAGVGRRASPRHLDRAIGAERGDELLGGLEPVLRLLLEALEHDRLEHRRQLLAAALRRRHDGLAACGRAGSLRVVAAVNAGAPARHS